ncbi:MAG: 16S rRNA (adenine(1518)-N(6)/adenine(1519)-N(6))-dimethyltransferase RsmA [Tannerellaceae bacterium]|nr:16S rRNA (adenine(1518)-N(6)/adenine(1519)-N(6))-dimethyltransferase RsmA [Tannerellaceae bacterium]
MTKKSLGQHFLRDEGIARRIADTLDGYRRYPVLEVGPGEGALTRHLLEAGYDLTVVEIDRTLADRLSRLFPSLEGRILVEDFLRMDLATRFPAPVFCLTGNYPYYISSQIFFKLIEERHRIPCCTGMIQREVAQRLAAPHGNRTYGILSVLIQIWYDVEYLFTVDENVFSPPPKVKSAVVRLTRNSRTCLPCDETRFRQVVKTAFNQRRKTLRNALKPLLSNYPHADASILSLRPEQLSPDDFLDLTVSLFGENGTAPTH